MSRSEGFAVEIEPIVRVPRRARPGETYLMTIDLRHRVEPEAWPYGKEEYALTCCLLDTLPLFEHRPLGEPVLILHRFGGTYGEARFLLRAMDREITGSLRLTLVNEAGLPAYTAEFKDIEILSSTPALVPETIGLESPPGLEPIGRRPTLELVSPAHGELNVSDHELADEHSVVIRNPGDVPVRIEGVEIRRAGGEELETDRDWLSLEGIDEGTVLEPGEERTLPVILEPGRRPREEYGEEFSRREIVLRHDGWPPDGSEREVRFSVSAQLGQVEEFAVGIDFGTSNSVVCLLGVEGAYALPLESDSQLSRSRPRKHLSSLMFFNSNARDDDPVFLYGEMAESSAGINPDNLVRNIKTLATRDPYQHFLFLRPAAYGSYERVEMSPQELLSLYIAELVRRAEAGVVYLSTAQLQDLGIGDHKVVFRRAVFTQPVGVNDAIRRAFMDAAHAAGVNTHIDNLGDYFRECCIDEASAAVLAYIRARILREVVEDQPLLDRERVICVDVGDTTDLAAVEVTSMAAYEEGEEEQVVVQLLVNLSSPFGSSDLDALLAEMMLTDIERQSRARRAPIDAEEIRYAIGAQSYLEFQRGFRIRKRSPGPREEGGDDVDERARRIYRKAVVELLSTAEQAKRRLSVEPEVDETFSDTDWPTGREAGTPSGENFEVKVKRKDFETEVCEKLGKLLQLIDSVVEGAGWEWPTITTLLFTGQGVRVPIIRQTVLAHVEDRRSDAAEALIRVEPDDGSGFDPKTCVAIGAAIWGHSRDNPDRWLKIVHPSLEQLAFDLQTRSGMRFKTVPGLESGVKLPAEATLELEKPIEELKLYRNKKVLVRFRFNASTVLKVCVNGPGDFSIFADGTRYPGEVLT